MKKLFAALAIATVAAAGPCLAVSAASGPTSAKAGTCEAQATEKKLAGAAKTSFVKKCEKDAAGGTAAAGCDAQAAEKKLAGAAKTSFVKKCIADAAK
jgi:hypothetical protein